MKKNALELQGIHKVFPGVIALENISACFEKGKVHALLGKNGSGKSTLVNIVAGIHTPTDGAVFINGKRAQFQNYKDASNSDIALVHQEMSLIPDLSIAENIFLGCYPLKFGCIDWKECFNQTESLLKRFQLSFPPDLLVRDLSIGQQQMIEITKALSQNPHILILDEPTSALAQHEVSRLFQLIRQLKDKGETVIYITHRLHELREIADTVTVLRDGRFIGQKILNDISNDDVVHMMFGSAETFHKETKQEKSFDEAVLKLDKLSRNNAFNEISFSLQKGEILGIAGMLGAGRTELLRSIFGLDSFDSGALEFNGEKIPNPTPDIMKKAGVAFVSEDRKSEGLIQSDSIHNNLCLAAMTQIADKGMTSEKKEQPYVQKMIDRLKIKIATPADPVSSLSGGNQQKVVVGNWLNCEPAVILFDEPSRGIDVAAKQQIFRIMEEQSRNGVSIIMVSTELEELVDVCDRILIMKDGKITGETLAEDITGNELYKVCMGT